MPKAKITSIEPKLDLDLVKMVEDILEGVKSKEITDVFAISIERGGRVSTHRGVDPDNMMLMLGHIEWAKWCMVERIGKTKDDVTDAD